MARGRTTITTLGLLLPVVAVALLTAAEADAATPTYYNNLPAFQQDITLTVTDDYSNPAYVFIQNNAAMNAVIGETDYFTTGFDNLNIVSGGVYCAGCNGSFELSFQTTSLGDPAGVNGVGMNIVFQDPGNPYFAYITFADGTTANIQLPNGGTFWGVAAPERIERIHFGLSMGGFTQAGSFGIDNLIVGDGNIGICEDDADCIQDTNPCNDHVCIASLCTAVPNVAPCDDGNPCTDDVCGGGVCTGQPNTAPCDDGNPCTDDICGGGACIGQFNSIPCDDGEVCTENDVCGLGMCQGSLISCNDDNPCTTDFCDFGVGCDTINNNATCDDANACTQQDSCEAGACGGTPVNCSDDDVCTANSCDPELGCVSEPIRDCCDEDADCLVDHVCNLERNTCEPANVGSEGGDSSSGGPAETSGPGETGVDGTAGETGGSTGAMETSNGETSAVGSTGDETSGGLDTPDASGCACTTTPSPAGRLWWLMLPLGLYLRRRRAA